MNITLTVTDRFWYAIFGAFIAIWIIAGYTAYKIATVWSDTEIRQTEFMVQTAKAMYERKR